jgi:hypothetical protein
MRRFLIATALSVPALALVGFTLAAWMMREFDSLVGAADFETWDPELDWLYEGDWDEETLTKEQQ